MEKKINEGELFSKYKSSYTGAFKDLSIHTFLILSSFYLIWFFRNSYVSFLTIPTNGLLSVRTFIIFHDCQHNSYTPNKTLNNFISHFLGILVFTSPNWIVNHKTHHLTNGNIENKYKYNFNELLFYNFDQYKQFDSFHKNLFVFFHTPIVYFSFFPFLYFFIMQRFIYIVNKVRYGNKIEKSLLIITLNDIINNIGILVLLYFLNKYQILTHFLFSFYFSSILGILLFFNQHTFNPAYVVGNEEWTQKNSGLEGSSFIQIPYLLKYFTMGIEYHHIHHMNSKIPGYNIQKYHEEVVSKSNIFDNIVILNMQDCFNNLWLMLYDNENKKYITIEEAEQIIKTK